MATVYGIVKQHGGYIECESEPGNGSAFTVYFPSLEPQPRFYTEEIEEMSEYGTETILMVDDEEYIRDFGKRVLSQAGYTVLTACNGKEALDLYRNSTNRISLVILDLIMPEMGGVKCFEELLAIEPRTKTLIVSGYSPEDPAHESVVRKAAGFIAKPFKVRELLRKVRKILDRDYLMC